MQTEGALAAADLQWVMTHQHRLGAMCAEGQGQGLLGLEGDRRVAEGHVVFTVGGSMV